MGFNSSFKTDYRESMYLLLLQQVPSITRNSESKKPSWLVKSNENPFSLSLVLYLSLLAEYICMYIREFSESGDDLSRIYQCQKN